MTSFYRVYIPFLTCQTGFYVLCPFGVPAMPPKAMRAFLIVPFLICRLNAPQTAEMSWSNRFEIL